MGKRSMKLRSKVFARARPQPRHDAATPTTESANEDYIAENKTSNCISYEKEPANAGRKNRATSFWRWAYKSKVEWGMRDDQERKASKCKAKKTVRGLN